MPKTVDNSISKDKLKTAQIGKCGELLVQYKLLKHAIESAPMTTDAGIDLVAYSPKKARPVTIQVKAQYQPTSVSGKGAMSVGWPLSLTSPAEMVALVDLKSEHVWLFWHHELEKFAQQKRSDTMQFSMYSDPEYKPRRPGCHYREYEDYLLESRVKELFGGALADQQ